MILLLLLLLLLPLLLFLFPHTDKCSMKTQTSPPLWSNILTMATGHVVWVLKVIPLSMEFGFFFLMVFLCCFQLEKKSYFEKREESLAKARVAIRKAGRSRDYTPYKNESFFPRGPVYRNPYAFYQLSFFFSFFLFFFFLRFLLLEKKIEISDDNNNKANMELSE